MEVEQIAEVCHEANRAYCLSHNDKSHKPWKETSWSTKQSAIAGVVYLIENPEASLAGLHQHWLDTRKREGWVYGEEKDELAKTHPCMLPYEELPELQKKKDDLFRAIVLVLTTEAFDFAALQQLRKASP